MLQHGRHAIALLALCAAVPAFAADSLPPELQALLASINTWQRKFNKDSPLEP